MHQLLCYTISYMETTRQEKIARLLQKELGELFLLYARQLQGVLITVTEVRVTTDLSLGRVFLSVFPTNKSAEVMLQVQADTKSIRFELGKRVRHQLRIVPELSFYLDESMEKLEHIDQLLKNTASE